MKISNETLNQLNELYTYFFMDENMNEVSPENSTHIHIGFALDERREPTEYISKTIKGLTKEMTLEYIVEKINAHSVYKSFAQHFGKLIKPLGLNAYPTTYGIGIFVMLMNKTNSEQIETKINTLLNELGISYVNEFSSARWVYRYKISKSKENIQQINNIINSEK